MPAVLRTVATRRTEQEMRKLERNLRGLVERYADEDDKARKETEKEMRTLVTSLFELRQEERRAQLEAMEARIVELRDEIEEREQDRKRIIDGFVDQQLRGEVDL